MKYLRILFSVVFVLSFMFATGCGGGDSTSTPPAANANDDGGADDGGADDGADDDAGADDSDSDDSTTE